MVEEVVVVSGKGGAGKTLVSAGLAALLAGRIRVVVDADAETPNLGIFLGASGCRVARVLGGYRVARIREDCCIGCGACAGVCVYGCIEFSGGVARVRGEEWCEGCGACVRACPVSCIGLVEEGREGIVRVCSTRLGAVLVEAVAPPGRPSSGRLVTEARLVAAGLGGPVLIDAAAGTGCKVVASVTRARLAVLVVEDTRTGAADALRLAGLLRHFRVPFLVVLNKYRGGVAERALREGIGGLRVVARIPYDQCVVDAYSDGVNPVTRCGGIRSALSALAEAVAGELGV